MGAMVSSPSRPLAGDIDVALAKGKSLYALGRSHEALPIARIALEQARIAGDPAALQRALTACGILAADAFDIVAGLDYHLQALKLVEGDRSEQARIWSNIGLAFELAGSPGLAVRAYSRALERAEGVGGPLYARYLAYANGAQSLFHLGRYEEGLSYALRAERELTPELAARDPSGVLLLHRNLVNLLVANGRAAEAAPHVDKLVEEARGSASPRTFIAAATARAVYELAVGEHDVALTRLERALAKARETPQALRDTLVCAIRAEEAAGSPERALARLQELSEHVYTFAITRAMRHVELSGMEDGIAATQRSQEQARARISAQVEPPDTPPGWEALRRLAVSAALRFDATGWHGVRVGAMVRALALACGRPPLEALELGLAAQLHDIGMISVPEAIAAQRTKRNLAERAAFLRHITAGADILRDPHPRVALAREIAAYHHAHWDGRGTPGLVSGRNIPLAARLCAVADAYDEMVCGFTVHGEMCIGEALKGLSKVAGMRLDPDLVRRFDAVIREEASSYGIDAESAAGLESFQELIGLLEEDRGFI
jgi:putative two-component system response regulator